MNLRETLKINKNGHLDIGGVDALDLVSKYGTPLYVFDTEYIENMCKTLNSALRTEYGKGFISYASKAFSCKQIYTTIKKFGFLTDVVSIGEFFTAVKAGFNPENIIFHGNNKTYTELDFMIKNNVGCIVIDSISEITDIEKICEKYNKNVKVLLRVNPGITAHTHHYIQTAKIDSKFGFSIQDDNTLKLIKKISKSKYLDLQGLHCHIGSQIFEIKSFKLAVQKMLEFYKTIKDKLNIEFSILNLGGGFGIYYSEGDLKLQLSDYYNFVKEISNEIKLNTKKYKIKLPTLILEPGRSIVGEAGITLYTAGRIKEIPNIKKYIGIDGGMFENPRYALYQAKYSVECVNKITAKKTEKYSIAGKCCESGDLIAEDVLLPKIKEGDILAVFSTGAYNYSMASNYNGNFIPPVVAVKNGKSKYWVKPQNLEDLIRNNV